MFSLSLPHESASTDGIRPVNVKTDLAPLADLIELVFANSMDSSGRAALREMRYMSKMGIGLNLLASVSELALGIRLGYVWIAEGRLVGNVSVYPANWPSGLGSAWIIANVGVHPDYQRRGIARQLMLTSMEMIRKQGGNVAVLQVDTDNYPARHLYETLGFINERGWTTWRRSSSARAAPRLSDETPFISRRRSSEWRAEYELAQRVRPAERGGLGWQRPLHVNLFRQSLAQRLIDWINLRSTERLVIHDESGRHLAASLWIESGFAASSIHLTLMVDPAYQGHYDDALLNTAVTRYSKVPLSIEHPMDETGVNRVLEHYRFYPQRTVMHMRWDVK